MEEEVAGIAEINSLKKQFDEELKKGIESGDLSVALELKEQLEQKITQVEEKIFPEKKNIKAMEEVLGVKFDVQPLPRYVTPEVRKKLEEYGFELFYIPKLDLEPGSPHKGLVEEKEVAEYRDLLEKRYPNWKNTSIKHYTDRPVNFDGWFWQHVLAGHINPLFFNGWVAVENLDKPNKDEQYKQTPTSELFGLEGRFGKSYDQLLALISENRVKLLERLGLPVDLPVRLPEAVEWNLIANIKGWGGTSSMELTDTPIVYTFAGDAIIAVGSSAEGGTEFTLSVPLNSAGSLYGFRLLIQLPWYGRE